MPVGWAGTEEELAPAIRAALTAPELRHGITAVHIESLRDGRVLFSQQADTALMPASNMKIVTAALALARLGPEYRFRTLLAAQADLDAGTLRGDLYLKGFGDPTLTTAALRELAAAAHAHGIRRVTGNLVVDESFFTGPRLGRGWSYDYLSDYYAMEVSALSVNGNVLRVTARPGAAVGQPVILAWNPPTGYPEVRNWAVTAARGARETLRLERNLGESAITVRGQIPLAAAPTQLEPITVADPAFYAGHLLHALLKEAGVAVEGAVRKGILPDTGATPVRERHSAPLSAILPDFLKPSDNHYGEQLLRTVAAELTGRAPRGAASPSLATVVRDFVVEIGGDPTSVQVADGSGLSRLNLVTPLTLIRILRWTREQPFAAQFARALPVAGVDGTLRLRMRETRAAGNLTAKTGTIGAVSALSGYVTSAGGEPLVFSLMMNHFDGPSRSARAAQDRIGVLLAELE